MVDFRWYINSQGIRGQKGEKGDKGFSPSITEAVNTTEEYRLKIVNEFDEFLTDNLRGNEFFEKRNPEGTYLRYDPETGKAYTDDADEATSYKEGVAKLATSEDIESRNNTKIVTPDLLVEFCGKYVDLTSEQTITGKKTFTNLWKNADYKYITSGDLYTQTGNPVKKVTDNTSEGKHKVLYHLKFDEDTLKVNTSDSDKLFVDKNSLIDNNTLKVVNGKIKVNYPIQDGLTFTERSGVIVPNLSIPILEVQGDTEVVYSQLMLSNHVPLVSFDTLRAGDNVSLTKNPNNGTITISSESGGDLPDNVLTKDGIGEVITGRKEFRGNSLTVASDKHWSIVATQQDGWLPFAKSPNDGLIEWVEFGNHYSTPVFSSSPLVERYNPVEQKDEAHYILDTGNVQAGDNITLDYTRDGIIINSTGGSGGAIIDDNTTATDKVYSSFKTSNLVGELGNEVNSIAGRLNTLEDEVVVATNDRLGLVKPDGNTITIDSNGELQTTVDINALQTKVDNLQLYKFPNATIEGDPTINNGQVSNFSTTNYLRFPFEFKTEGRTWLLNGSFDTNSDVTTQQNIIDSLAAVALAVRNDRLVLALSTNGTSFDLGEHLSMSDILPNTKYYYRLSFSGTQYLLSISTDKQEWLPEIQITSSTPIASRPMTISSTGHPFGGTINLNDWDLTVGNVLVWQGMDDVGIASRMDVNASNITQTGIDKLKELLLGDVEALVDAININYNSNNEVQALAATPMMLALEPLELDSEDRFNTTIERATFDGELDITPTNFEAVDYDDTDIDLGGNE